jgi:hypothetical protein
VSLFSEECLLIINIKKNCMDIITRNFSKFLTAVVLLFAANGFGQTLLDSYADGNFTATPVWGGNTANWAIVANSDAAAGATGSNTLRFAGPATTTTEYLSTQVSSWGTSQEWGFWVGRRAQAYTAANQMYIWLYANESTLNNGTVDGYRIAIGDDAGDDNLRLEYIVNGAVSATVITSAGAVTNGITDVGFLVRVTRSAAGAWQIFTSALPTANGAGAIATDIPNTTNAATSQGTAINNSLVPASNGYFGVAALHSTGANAIIANELDQIYFTPTIVGPEINLQGNGNTITNADATPSATDFTDFGSVDVTTGTLTRTFTIQNTGTANLTVGTISFSGTNAADFSVTTAPTSPVAGPGSTTFIVTFDPSGTGARTATISIVNDDSDENPYTFAITGAGTTPEINLQGNATSIVSGDATPTTADWTDFGSVNAASGTLTRTFTIQNTGTGSLSVGTISFSGSEAADFSVTTSPTSPVAAAGSTTFIVTFDPGAVGARNATISIVNGDTDENPYTFAITGTGAAAAATVDYANIQFPTSASIPQGTTVNVYAQAYEPGLTEAAGAGAGLNAWVGYSSTNSDPSGGGWTWVAASFNAQAGNNDEFVAALGTGLTPGTYYYASRFQINTGGYVYGGTSGVWASTANNGVLTVTSNVVDFANIQSPATASITEGSNVTVFAQVYEPGVTEAAGQGAGISSMDRIQLDQYKPEHRDHGHGLRQPTILQAGNNDEYMASIGSALAAPGTYYYASRFQKTGSTEYVYGGTAGIWSSNSGVLTINPNIVDFREHPVAGDRDDRTRRLGSGLRTGL